MGPAGSRGRRRWFRLACRPRRPAGRAASLGALRSPSSPAALAFNTALLEAAGIGKRQGWARGRGVAVPAEAPTVRHGESMLGRNESCSSEQIPMSYIACLLYILEEWTGVQHLEDYLNYVVYLLWLFAPLVVSFILPGLILLLLYVSVIILHIYKRRTDLKEAYCNDFWDGARQMLATLWYGHAKIWNGYEVHGLEKIPDGPALVVFYHGATPIDFFYFMATILIRKKRICHIVADHFVFSIPGFKLLLDVFCVKHGTQEECVKALRNGDLLAIAPGGVREALFSNENYSIIWGNRKGFAQVAIDAKVPIIPMFTQNVREGIRSLGGIKLFRLMYEYLRLPIVPLYGNFPIKLRTFLGEPIPYQPRVTSEELAEQAKSGVQFLINKHQKLPGNVFRALMERFTIQKKED